MNRFLLMAGGADWKNVLGVVLLAIVAMVWAALRLKSHRDRLKRL